MISTVWSLSCSSTLGYPRAQSFVKVGARDPVPHGVGATFVGAVLRQKHDKAAIQSKCAVSQGLYSICLRSKLCTE